MTRQRLLDRIAALGATYEEGGERLYEITIDTPAGMVFAADGLHSQVTQQGYGEPRGAVYALAMDRMAMGLIPCDDPECEVCGEARVLELLARRANALADGMTSISR